MKRLQILQKLVYRKFYVHGIAPVILSKIYFLENAKNTCKPNNRDLNRDWIICLKSFSALNKWYSEIHNISHSNVQHNFLKICFFPSTSIAWNNLDSNIRNFKSYTAFKESVLKFIRPYINNICNYHNWIAR